MTKDRNVIVCGQTGAGKSSVVNMLQSSGNGRDADVSSAATGVTFQATRYSKTIANVNYNVYDTVGLNEGAGGSTNATNAIRQLYNLLKDLIDGINLLVFVVRAPHITAKTQENYDMFFKHVCSQKVPIIIVITGLENERLEDAGDEESDDEVVENWNTAVDKWIGKNRKNFVEGGYTMKFEEFVGITAIKGVKRRGRYPLEGKYEASRKRLEAAITRTCSQQPWTIPLTKGFAAGVIRAKNLFARFFNMTPWGILGLLYDALVSYGGLSAEEAKAETNAHG
jgi:predicted GTPase